MLKDTNLPRLEVMQRSGTFRLICLAIAGMAAWGGAAVLAARPDEGKAPLAAVGHYDLNSEAARIPALPPLGRLPVILSNGDADLYRAAFSLQKRGDWKAADASLRAIDDKRLIGHVLADRYRHRSYATRYEELVSWLKRYPDLPDARALYTLALSKKPADTWLQLAPASPHTLTGYGEEAETAASSLGGNALWREGLAAWKARRYEAAADRFTRLAASGKIFSGAESAALHYWAWRALERTGSIHAARHLAESARQPRSFYGILARKQLGQPLGLARTPEALSEAEVAALYAEPAVGRIVALAQINQPERAEAEMRRLFPESRQAMQTQLIVVASELGLSAVQMRMAQTLKDNKNKSKDGYDYALYPRLGIAPSDGFMIEPELIFAFARAESGFHAKAESEAGALGLMQIMPDTANYMARMEHAAGRGAKAPSLHALREPALNVSLGQSYIRYLMERPGIGGNLFYLAAAYNAGPGKLAEWRRTIDFQNDPLLFVETVPYAETRRYIARVMTNYWIYSDLTERESTTVQQVARGRWPLYEGSALAARDVAMLAN